LVVNPGSTSTKIAFFVGEECIFSQHINHPRQELLGFGRIIEQLPYRLNYIKNALKKAGISPANCAAVVGRGGLLHPMAGGTYQVNEAMLADLEAGIQGEHPANLGGIIAHKIGVEYGIPAFIVDPVSVDEMDAVCRISGLKEITRSSLGHYLNVRRIARLAAEDMGKDYGLCNFVLAHLGGGISIFAMYKGRLVDVDSANHEGPFSPNRTGGLSSTDLIELCYSGKYTKNELLTKILHQGGVYSYLGTADIKEVEAKIVQGDKEALIVLEAMALQIAKNIAAMATVLKGVVDAVILTGGVAYSQLVTNYIRERVEFIAPVLLYPGEEEMAALAEGALRVVKGEEAAKVYMGKGGLNNEA
jgi:butyrate kinase